MSTVVSGKRGELLPIIPRNVMLLPLMLQPQVSSQLPALCVPCAYEEGRT